MLPEEQTVRSVGALCLASGAAQPLPGHGHRHQMQGSRAGLDNERVLQTSGMKASCFEFRETIIFAVTTSIFGYFRESIDEDKGGAPQEIPALTTLDTIRSCVRIKGGRHICKGNECCICRFSTKK